jgi:ABC-2 type transport system ATP-binding protein
MRKRLAMAAAIIDTPRLLLMDDPLAGMDPSAQTLFRQLLRELSSEGTAILWSTHRLSEAEKICDKIGIIHRGKLLLTGKTEEITGNQEKHRKLEEIFMKLTCNSPTGTSTDE